MHCPGLCTRCRGWHALVCEIPTRDYLDTDYYRAAFVSIVAALLVTMIAISIQRPGHGIDATTTVSVDKAFLAVTNIVFAYGKYHNLRS